MIYYRTPYSLDKRLDEYYNAEMALLPNDDDWCCFLDGDAMFLTPDFGHQIQEIVTENTEYDLFTCMTNRVGTKYQCVEDMWQTNDIEKHREVAEYYNGNDLILDITTYAPLSGVMILLNKKAWRESGGFTHKGMLGVDNSIHYNVRNAGMKVGLMLGVYVYHWYRGGDAKNKAHLL